MAISVNINGVNKNVVNPETCVDGIWRQVNVVSNNINGVWRESFNRNIYKIKLYRYGVLYDTLSVQKGSSITLPSVTTVQSDDITHYGWATTATATARNYSATQTITPTGNMDLYAVYSYKATVQTTKYAGASDISGIVPSNYASFPITIETAGTLTYKAYNAQRGQVAGGAPINTSAGIVLTGTTYTGSLYQNATIKVNNTLLTGVFETASSEALTYEVSVGDVISASYTVESQTASNNYGSYDILHYPVITVGYPALTTQTKYRASI